MQKVLPDDVWQDHSDELLEVTPQTAEVLDPGAFGWPPLNRLLENPRVTEILVNSPEHILYEEAGKLLCFEEKFPSEVEFINFLHRVMEASGARVSIEQPFGNGQIKNMRVHIAGSAVTNQSAAISLRRHPESRWNFEALMKQNWAEPFQLAGLRKILHSRSNFLVVGPTSAGKTSVLDACLGELPDHERLVLIEDTAELCPPNKASIRLQARIDATGELAPIDQAELVKQSLRMRPDRLVLGEVRGGEAKDFLLALSTGHSGSFGSLHARSAQEALLRLEMLVQMGAPQWNLLTIRKLIFFGLQYIMVLSKQDGLRKLEGIYKIASLEESGFLLDSLE